MANTVVVCLLATFLCCTGLSYGKQVPAHCAKGPEVWCKGLRKAAECGAVQHCIATVWEHRATRVKFNGVSSKLLSFFEEMKDVNELINNAYLANRMVSACRQIAEPHAATTCTQNTVGLEEYLGYLLSSKTSPETICTLIEMCDEVGDNKMELTSLLAHPESTEPKRIIDKKRSSMPELIGAEKCTWGPSYWCHNFTTGRECKAMHHCLTRVWPNTKFREDNDDICKICKDMVQQARDQLTSNETQTELKEVFEGSCHLIPIKIVAQECMKLADEFVPELVETLSSQMNPTAVCSVAGLCNNPDIDEMLKNYNAHVQHFIECGNCKNIVNTMRKKFLDTPYDDFLVLLLQICRKMSSLSDSCSMLAFKYYENIRAAIQQDLKPHTICHVSGDCAHAYHSHDEYIFPATIEDGGGVKEDVPCAFCEQLVTHLRDVLVANTTEDEFFKVLRGLCKQSGKFKTECLSLAEEYYGVIYKYLTDDLKGDKICTMIGICHNPTVVRSATSLVSEPVQPLLLSSVAVTVPSSLTSEGSDDITLVPLTRTASVVTTSNSPVEHKATTVEESETSINPLPIERMFISMPENKFTCNFCEYLLHYLQVEISDSKNENIIREAVMHSCERLPKLVNNECKQFVSEYGPAVIALLVQEIDPASVCPALRICPVQKAISVLATAETKSGNNCPLCLFAVEQLETVLKNNKTEENIHKALNELCGHLSARLKAPCVQFVNNYSKVLLELLLADLNSQEICIYLKLCKDKTQTQIDGRSWNHMSSPVFTAATTKLTATENTLSSSDSQTKIETSQPHLTELYSKHTTLEVQPKKESTLEYNFDVFMQSPSTQADYNHMKKTGKPSTTIKDVGDIETNEIHDDTANGQPIMSQKSVCVICEFVMKEIDDQIKDKHNEDEIKRIVTGICNRMPKSVRSDCDQFVEKYADLIISLLAQELEPDQVCEELKLCVPTKKVSVARKETDDSQTFRFYHDVERKITTSLKNYNEEDTTGKIVFENDPDFNGLTSGDNLYSKRIGKEYTTDKIDFEVSTDVGRETIADNTIIPKGNHDNKEYATDKIDFEFNPDVDWETVEKNRLNKITKGYHDGKENATNKIDFEFNSDVERVTIAGNLNNRPKGYDYKEHTTGKITFEFNPDDEREILAVNLNNISKGNDYKEHTTKKIIFAFNPDAEREILAVNLNNVPTEKDDNKEYTTDKIIFEFDPDVKGQTLHSYLVKIQNEKDDNKEHTTDNVAFEFKGQTLDGKGQTLDGYLVDLRNDTENTTGIVVFEFNPETKGQTLAVNFESKAKEKAKEKAASEETDDNLYFEVKPEDDKAKKLVIDVDKMLKEKDVHKEEILDCAVCETVVMAVKKVLKNDAVDKNVVHIIEKSCGLLPSKYYDRCQTMMQIYGDSIIHLVEDFGSKQVCQKVGLCSSFDAAFVQMYHEKSKDESQKKLLS